MAVLERQHPDLKMDELAASVTEYMNEEATKNSGERTGPNTIGETTCSSAPTPAPTPTPINVTEVSTPYVQLARLLMFPHLTIQQE